MKPFPMRDSEPNDKEYDKRIGRTSNQSICDDGDQSGMTIYMKGVSDFDLLSSQEELHIGRRLFKIKERRAEVDEAHLNGSMDDGEHESKMKLIIIELQSLREQLINPNLRLVVSIAKHYQYRGLLLPDLINEGNIGLIEAINHFDYRRGCRFSTFATWRIRQALLKAIADKSRIIRIPLHMQNKIKRCKYAHRILLHKYGREPSHREVADYLKIPEQKVREYEDFELNISSLDSFVDREQLIRLGDLICRCDDDWIERGMIHESLQKSISLALSLLSEREEHIIRLRYGLNNEQPLTLEATGKKVGITRERVRQLQEKSIEKMRRFTIIQELRSYI